MTSPILATTVLPQFIAFDSSTKSAATVSLPNRLFLWLAIVIIIFADCLCLCAPFHARAVHCPPRRYLDRILHIF